MKYSTMTRAGAGVLSGHLLGRPAPLFVILAVTDRCNSGCSYCKIPGRGNKELSFEQVRSLIDQVSAMGCQRLGLWGGEPLMREDIGEIVDYAVSRKLYVTLDSNGFLFPQKAGLLKNLSHLILSFDGPRQAHDRNRAEGGFDRVHEALRVARERKMRTWTITVLTRNNIDGDSIRFIMEKAGELDFVPTFQLLYHGDTMGDSVTLRPSGEEYRHVLGRLMEHKRRGLPIGTSLNCLAHLRDWPDYSRNRVPEPSPRFRCWGGRFFANVDTAGFVYPCSLLVDEAEALNFLDAGFEAALARASSPACSQCIATCYSEYNMLFSLDAKTIWEWVSAFRKQGARLDSRP
jgi:MoaA/NifB/PqqE/SkfB family radical SAM enzyme